MWTFAMKKEKFLLWAILIISLLSFGCEKKSNPFGKPDKGTISGSTYSNSFFGFSFPLSKGWYILNEAEISTVFTSQRGSDLFIDF